MAESCSIEDCGSRPFCRGWCTKHYTRWQRHGDPLAITRRAPAAPDASEAYCPRCQQTKSVVYFGRRSALADSPRKGYCRDCERAYHEARQTSAEVREARRADKRKYARSDRSRELRLGKLYGITLADYEAMLDAQGRCCAICSTDKPGGNAKHWHVDHCHSTGRVRGLLCSRCNLAIGQFNDDPELLIRACVYLGAVPTERALAYYQRAS